MPETFTPTIWVDGPGGGTPITAAQLNRVEAGVESMDDRVTALEDTAGIIGLTVQSGTAYTFGLADVGKVVQASNAGAQTYTIPPDSSVAFSVGTILEVMRYGAGTLTVAAGAGVTVRSASSNTARAQYSPVSAVKVATNEWVLSGDLT